MRDLAHHVYTVAFRAQALIGLVFVVWLISSVPNAISAQPYVGVPLSLSVIAGVVSLALLWPYLTPEWMSDPSRLGHVVPVVVANIALPILFGFIGGFAIVNSNLAPPLDNTMGLIMGAFLLVAGATCLFLGAALCFWAETPDDAETRDNVSVLVPLHEARPLPRDIETPELDFHAAREARVSRVG